MAVITNIDADHMETYGHDFERLKRAFVDFAQRLPFYGVAVLCIDDPNVREILPAITKPIVTYGMAADARIRADRHRESRRPHALRRAAPKVRPTWPSSSTCPACTTCRTRSPRSRSAAKSGVAAPAIAKALAEFRGVGRRFQRYGDARRGRRRHAHADRRLRSPPDRDGGDDRRRARQLSRPAARARVPAAPLHPHPRPVRGLRPGAVDRRCAGADRSLSGRRTADRRGGRPRARPRRPGGGQGRAGVRRIRRRAAGRDPRARRATATWSSRWAPGSIGQTPQLSVRERAHDDERAADVHDAARQARRATSRSPATRAGAAAGAAIASTCRRIATTSPCSSASCRATSR